MPKTSDQHHMYLRHNTWMLRFQIPKDIQSVLGKKQVQESTGLKRHEVAEAMLMRDLRFAEFKLKTRALRRGEDISYINKMEANPETWGSLMKSKGSDDGRGLDVLVDQFNETAFDEAIKLFVSDELRSRCPEGTFDFSNGHHLDGLEYIDNVAYQNIQKHLSMTKGKTFGSQIERYMETPQFKEQSSKYRASIEKAIREFTQVEQFIENINKVSVNDWVEDQNKNGGENKQGLKLKTISVKLGSLAGYWDYLERVGLVDPNKVINPFRGQRVKVRKTTQRQIFKTDEVKRLVEGDTDILLLDLIKLGLLTGCRMIELCNIKKENIIFHENIRVINFTEEMTKSSASGKQASGVRKVPITSLMEPIINRLIADQHNRKCYPEQKGRGFLFDVGLDQHGSITGVMSKRWQKYKTSLGFPKKTHVAHSFRHTANNVLGRNGVEQSKRDTLLGWTDGGKNSSMAGTEYADLDYLYPVAERKKDLEILCNTFHFF
jgi:integrase